MGRRVSDTVLCRWSLENRAGCNKFNEDLVQMQLDGAPVATGLGPG